MEQTYAVKWRDPDGATYLGRLALGPTTLFLVGRSPRGDVAEREIRYSDVRGLHVGGSGARLDGRPALVVERRGAPYLVASAGMGAGIVHELADRLASLAA